MQEYYSHLIDSKRPIADRYFAVFHLKDIATNESIKLLMDSYEHCQTSILLKHEILYALGQLKEEFYEIVRDFLIKKVSD